MGKSRSVKELPRLARQDGWCMAGKSWVDHVPVQQGNAGGAWFGIALRGAVEIGFARQDWHGGSRSGQEA
jgi:hypothetical protein